MIIKHGYKQSTGNTYKADRRLFLKEIHIITDTLIVDVYALVLYSITRPKQVRRMIAATRL